MIVAIRADASRDIGAGHVMRCRSLAAALRARGVAVLFICRDQPGNLAEMLRQDKYEVHLLPAQSRTDNIASGYAAWLGASEDCDAEETIAALPSSTDWVIADHYALSPRWEAAVRSDGRKLLVIDDLGRSHTADILLDQNFSLQAEARYHGRLNSDCRALLGPRFALLQGAYADVAPHPRVVGEKVQRIFVFYGGADPSGMTLKTLKALSDPMFSDIAIDVVVGPMNPHAAAISALAAQQTNITLHAPQPTLAALLARADLAFGAGGGNTWERCCLGVPAVVVSIAGNQVPASKDLDRAGIVRYLGPDTSIQEETIRDAASLLIADVAGRHSMAMNGQRLADGRGVDRVSEILIPTTVPSLRLRPARSEDVGFYFDLVNDPVVRKQSFNTEPVKWENHVRWFAAKLRDPAARLLVLEATSLPVGQIRFDMAEGRATIDYALDPLVRGRGWGTVLMDLGLRAIAGEAVKDVVGLVKRENRGSCAVFEKLGFKSLHGETDDRAHYSMTADDLHARFSRHSPDGVVA